MQLFESEMQILKLLWQEGELTAKEIAMILEEKVGWKKTTTYTVIKKCISKGIVMKKDPHYICVPLISKEEVQREKADELIKDVFDGSIDNFFAAFVSGKKLSEENVHFLEKLINEYKDEEDQ
ncbi:BlaI/MecI/CopY family transcriptional regulator [Enterococcus sp. LJL128]|uniref:BlaI/MecI/CopY family transcriptional regulator n=1 Tax=Enterococcus sp. LJL51 TaxID=3416656 RepID=UPI003CEF34FC